MFSILMLLLMVQIASGSENPGTTETAPRAVFVENTWQFEPVIEGTEVIHDFSVKNRGRSPLEILNVKTS
jgi:hypothetical protein